MHSELHFYIQKSGQFALHFHMQKLMQFFHLLNAKSLTLCVTFLYAKKCTLRCIFLSKIYRMVLIPNYKHTYNQSDQIERALC